ncbi:hypothetical protein [Mycoplasma todarodis]|uniref:hypothetical protein n=1 Tax=Mycoplasma todarodis TaxID=1937191 RepID=UPI003B384DE2
MQVSITRRISAFVVNLLFCYTIIGAIINVILINKKHTSLGGILFKYTIEDLENNKLAYIVLSILQLNAVSIIINIVMIKKWEASMAEKILNLKKYNREIKNEKINI